MRAALVLVLLSLACGGGSSTEPRVGNDPISVRGWIYDVEDGVQRDTIRTAQSDYARKVQMFKSTNVWVDGAPYVSGTIAENGSFILLDVPSGNTIITFSAPGAHEARLILRDVPGNSDVLVPALVLRAGSTTVLDPRLLRVRMAARVDKPVRTDKHAFVNGHRVNVVNTPFGEMVDRRDFPNPPGSEPPLATVK